LNPDSIKARGHGLGETGDREGWHNICFSSFSLVARGILSAPAGHQDSQGFHAAVTPTAAQDDSHLAYSEAHAGFSI